MIPSPLARNYESTWVGVEIGFSSQESEDFVEEAFDSLVGLNHIYKHTVKLSFSHLFLNKLKFYLENIFPLIF